MCKRSTQHNLAEFVYFDVTKYEETDPLMEM